MIEAGGVGFLLEAEGIHKSFRGRHVLNDINLALRRGLVLSLMGPSGAGKTTLLRCLNLLAPIDEGVIRFEGRTVISAAKRDPSPLVRLFAPNSGRPRFERRFHLPAHVHRRSVGLVFQDFNLWPHKTVISNLIEGPVHILGESSEAARERAKAVLHRLHLPEVLERFPIQLSGGQRQRVAIARALLMNCQVLLLDEVTSALDPGLVRETLELIKGIAKEGVAIIFVTHQIELARFIADQIAVIESGHLIENGPTVEVLTRPRDPRTIRFLRM